MKPADAFLVSCLAAAPSHTQVSSVPVQCALEEAKLLPTPGEPKELFGQSIAVSGDTVVVGSYASYQPFTPIVEAVYVFVRGASGQWSQQARLVSPAGVDDENRFGYAVAISGDTIVVGAPEVNGFNIDAGAAYVYVREGTLWSFQQKIQPGLPQEAHFGWAVAIEGDTLAVGSPEDLFPCPCPGSVYVYDRSGGSWTFVQRLTGSNGQPDYVFGHSVSISGDRILVGDAGSAYVFERQGTTWLEEVQLLSPNPFVGAAFGVSVSLSGDTAVVGARLDNCAGQYAGPAYVSVDQGTTWALQVKLVGHDTTDDDH